MRLFLASLLMLVSHQVALGADDQEWLKTALKNENPNELTYFVVLNPECPIAKDKVASLVEGVLVRSRIKPLGGDEGVGRELFLNVATDCVSLANNNPVYVIDVIFGKYVGDIAAPMYYGTAFGYLGIGPVDHIEKALKENIELVITAYLRVNIDLGD